MAQENSGARQTGGATPAESLVGLEPAGMPLMTIKQAEDGRGFIFRLCDFAGADGTARLALPEPARELFNCNLVETELGQLKGSGKNIAVPVRAFAPVTVKAVF